MIQSLLPVEFPTPVGFPKSWKWFMDQRLIQWVKDHYSPQESWKGKPFTNQDAHFFFRGIEELSDIFTQDRGRALQRYFEHPRFRSSYLLYFLPLQAAKFVALFERHQKFLIPALQSAAQKGTIEIVDLGAGPFTASIAFVLWFLDHTETLTPEGGELPKIRITGVDSQATILKEGAELLKILAEGFPRLRGKVQVETQVTKWQDWVKRHAKSQDAADLYLMGHVLNEGRGEKVGDLAEAMAALLEKNPRAGALMVEPAAKNASQFLSQLRDVLLEELPVNPVGPCPHRERCPLAGGGDWCHFSFPAEVPGAWFSRFSKGLGSERQFLKLSYLWLADSGFWKTGQSLPSKDAQLLVSDSLTRYTGRTAKVAIDALVCAPDRTQKVSLKVPLEKLRGPLALRGGYALAGGSGLGGVGKDSAGPPKGTGRRWQAKKDRR